MFQYLSMAAAAAIDLFLAIPIAVAAKAGFVETFLAMAIGGTVGAALVVYLGDALRSFWAAHRKVRAHPKPAGWLERQAKRFGAPGLGLLSPVLIGSPAGAAIGAAMGLEKRVLLAWLTAGVVLWSAVLAGLTSLGVTALG
ncbi:MAG: hypothetical protein AAFY28_09140 [Actinomycetota bacterium]